MIKVDQFGKDHWSTFGYIETRVVDHEGHLAKQHMRCDPTRHPAHAHAPGKCPSTRLRDGNIDNHDDWDCAEDLGTAGLITIGGTDMYPVFALTEEGVRVASLLRAHKAKGGNFSTFRLDATEHVEKP